ncbi:1,2-phenylacetyl-CoA epoxidase subunit PaaB [Arthrobacter oryzae]|uniref:1,2-phenylacetyl-CoA epoxidase subunit PaaB n=1 Tax=Arthrobacter oryzae TaxID=409290 RepID=UPI00285B6B16|nr:1,2-phenylacetyl-CoA epoxidase subunit PaaB [Arthrobacter oryzae]MDR6505085.1 ring-1,2-phenylacetyl-CoA epoxidase subunit PaaB [Arthrobacter oryzae]
MSPHGNPEFPASTADSGSRSIDKAEDQSADQANAPTGVPAADKAVAASPEPAIDIRPAGNVWPIWEVFVRSSRGLSHVHAGSLHAPDAAMALRNARDLYTRRNEGVSIWVVPADAIASSDPDAKGSFFESPQGKDYRHATYYTKSEGVKHL